MIRCLLRPHTGDGTRHAESKRGLLAHSAMLGGTNSLLCAPPPATNRTRAAASGASPRRSELRTATYRTRRRRGRCPLGADWWRRGRGGASARRRARGVGSAARGAEEAAAREAVAARAGLGSLPEAQAPRTQPASGRGSLCARHGDQRQAFPPGGVRCLRLHRPVRDGGGGPGADGPAGELPPGLGRGGPLPGQAAASAGAGGPETG